MRFGYKNFALRALAFVLWIFNFTPTWATNVASPCNFSIDIKFTESAPRDRFTIKNTSISGWTISELLLSLSSSKGNLIFDVTAQGEGVEVFQPFRSEDNDAGLRDQPVINDGDQSIALAFSSFTPGKEFVFTIDVDDQLIDSVLGQIRVAGSEMQGATVVIGIVNEKGLSASVKGKFDNQSQIQIQLASDECIETGG